MVAYKYFRKIFRENKYFCENFRTNKYFREQFRKNLAKSYDIEVCSQESFLHMFLTSVAFIVITVISMTWLWLEIKKVLYILQWNLDYSNQEYSNFACFPVGTLGARMTG